MISTNDAFELIAKYPLIRADRSELVEFNSGINNIIAKPLFADRNYPPYDRSMMDGIVVNYDSIKNNQTEFILKGVIAAGEPTKPMDDVNSCYEIMTGAVVPSGNNVVIPIENVEIISGIAKIKENTKVNPKQYIHFDGTDIKAGDEILCKGSDLKSPHVAIAASIGQKNISVLKKAKIAVISTGNELVEIDQTPKAYQIRRSNVYTISNSLKEYGFHHVDNFHLQDDFDSIQSFYQKNASIYDYLFFSGGVSKGKFDYLPKVFEKEKVKKVIHRISQRPGKPLWFGVDDERDCVVVGLPGNPISGLICLHRYFLAPSKTIYAKLNQEIRFNKELTYFVPVSIHFNENAQLVATPLIVKNSGEFSGLAMSDGFIELPLEREVFNKGENFKFYPWRKWV